MKNRDDRLIDLRPILHLEAANGIIEQFQNNTLRPILKFQNNLILQISIHQFIKRKSVFFDLAEIKQLEYIVQQVQQDRQFRNLLHGLIIGQFTLEEWDFFKLNEQELRKRLNTLLIQRLQSQIHTLVS